MIVFVLLFLALSPSSGFGLFSFFAKLALPLQSICENLTPQELIFKSIQRSLLCGTSLSDSALSLSLRQQGLIHLFVVSGGHFLFLEKTFQFLRCPGFLSFPALLFYNFVTGFQAPGTRFLVQMILGRYQLFPLRQDQLQFFAGLATLVFFPELTQSLSFLLSWTAALALSISSFLFYTRSLFQKIFFSQALITIILFPWLWSFGTGHPLGILSNIILGPIILFVLFPLSFIVVVVPPTSVLFDQATLGFEFLLLQTNRLFPLFPNQPLHFEFFWLYLLCLQGGFHFYQIHRWRNAS